MTTASQLILIVDDSAPNLSWLEATLASPGVTLIKALGGDEALVATSEHNFALALIDVMMPDMDGYELAERLRGNPRTQHLPIIFITASDDSEAAVSRGYGAGAVDYIVKPCNGIFLKAKVQVFLELDRQRRELLENELRQEALVQLRTQDLSRALDELALQRDDAQRKARERDALLRATRTVLTEPRFELAAGQIFEFCRELVGAKVGYFALPSRGQPVDVGLALERVGVTYPVARDHPTPIPGPHEEARGESGVLCDNDYAHSAWQVPIPSGQVPLESVLFAPVRAGAEVVGWLALANKPGGFREDDARLARAFAEIASVALKNWMASRALERSESQFRAFFENAPDYCFILSPAGLVVDANRAACETLGWQPQELVGQPLAAIFAPEAEPRARHAFETRERTGPVVNEELTVLAKSGERRTVLVSVTGYWDERGELQHSLCVQRDITERKQSEGERAATRARREALNLLQHSMMASAPLAEKLTSITETIVRAFDADFCRIWLIRPGDRCEKGCVHASGTDDLNLCRNRDRCLHLVASSGRYTHTDGLMHSRVPVGCYKIGGIASEGCLRFLTNEVTVDPRVHDRDWARRLGLTAFAGYQIRMPDGPALGVLALFSKHAISPDDDSRLEGLSSTIGLVVQKAAAEEAQARLEVQLRSAQKMEAIGNLAGGVAHDFNNLLTVILGNTGFALDEVGVNEPLRDALLEIQKAGDRAAGLTRQLLAFGRRQRLQPKLLGLNQVIADLEKMLRRIIGEDVELSLVLAADLGLTMADPGQIEQVVMNLVVNARDAMPDGGSLTIETRNVDLESDRASGNGRARLGPQVLLSVSDSGCGMSPPTLERIFEPFFTTKEMGKGTGLGLATVHGIVAQSGGAIEVKSTPGAGTTFEIWFPRVTAATLPTSDRPAVATRASGTETILVVEDDQTVRSLASRILSAAGYVVLTAANGPEALQLSETHQAAIDLLFTDTVMPQMSGAVVANRLVAKRPGLKVLFTSGYADRASAGEVPSGRVASFLGKPFTADSLTRKVRDLLDGRQSPSGCS